MKNSPIFIATILLFTFLSCQQKNETKTKDSQYQEEKDCICQEDLKSNDGVLAYNPVLVKKKDGDYLQFQCASMMRLYMRDKNGNEFEKNKVGCMSSKKQQLKLNKNFVYYIPTADEKDTLSLGSSRQIFFDRLKQKGRFYQLSLSDQKQITNINDFYYESDEDQISKIEVSRYGGRPGIKMTLTITADSFHYSYKENSAQVGISKSKANTYKNWDDITHSFLLSDFAKLKSGKSRQPADGVDVKFTIVTKTKTYSVLNFDSDPSHHKIKEFVKVLNEYEKEISSSEK